MKTITPTSSAAIPPTREAEPRQNSSYQTQAQSQENGNETPLQSQEQQQPQTGEASSGPWFTPSREEIELAAYHLYSTRGFEEGHDLDNWLEAEQILQNSPASRLS